MTLAQVIAILGLLTAFQVPQPVINNVSDILMAKVATTTAAAAPIVQATSTFQVAPTGEISTPAPIQLGAILQVMPENKSALTIEQNGTLFKVRVLDADGKATEGAVINMDAPDMDKQPPVGAQRQRAANARNTAVLNDWYADFGYTAVTKGQQTITFTSGALTKSVTIEVQ